MRARMACDVYIVIVVTSLCIQLECVCIVLCLPGFYIGSCVRHVF